MNWLTHFFGLDDPSGSWYLFWSGVGADISELAIVGGMIGILRKHNCHIKGCWRIGRHKAGDHIVCARHHPEGPPAAKDITR